MPSQLTLTAQEGLPVKLAIEPFAFELSMEPGWQYRLVSEESEFTVEHSSQQLTICLDQELKAQLLGRPDPLQGDVQDWQVLKVFA
jgi:hypothetical protein